MLKQKMASNRKANQLRRIKFRFGMVDATAFDWAFALVGIVSIEPLAMRSIA